MSAPADACSFWPDVIGSLDLTRCCAAHDSAYEAGGSLTDFLAANIELGRCVASLGGPTSILIGGLMLAGTTAFGWFFWRSRASYPSIFQPRKGPSDGH